MTPDVISERRIPDAAFAFGLLVAFLVASPAAAHSRRGGGDRSGVAFDAVSHGEMPVLAAYRGEIHRLAQGVVNTDPAFRRLMNYSAIEFSYYCAWGLAPGALRDEASPFNECAHAYLAADKALLLRMRAMPETRAAAEALVSRIDADAARVGAAFIGCRYSDAAFNTAEFITPHWEDLPGHPPTLAAAAGLALAGAAGVAAPFLRRRRS